MEHGIYDNTTSVCGAWRGRFVERLGCVVLDARKYGIDASISQHRTEHSNRTAHHRHGRRVLCVPRVLVCFRKGYGPGETGGSRRDEDFYSALPHDQHMERHDAPEYYGGDVRHNGLGGFLDRFFPLGFLVALLCG